MSLAHFREAERRLSETTHVIPRLGQIICDHNMQEVVGVVLLHKHFDISSAERVVRKYRDQGAHIYPDVNLDDLVGSSWRFAEGAWYPIEFSNTTNVSGAFQEAETLCAKAEFIETYGEELHL